MICPKCGNWIPDDARRCPGCSEILKNKENFTEQPEFDRSTKKGKNKKEKKQATVWATDSKKRTAQISDSDIGYSDRISRSAAPGEKCTKIYIICASISILTTLLYYINASFINWWVLLPMLAQVLAILAVKNRKPLLMFAALAVYIADSVIYVNTVLGYGITLEELLIRYDKQYILFQNQSLLYLFFSVLGTVLLFFRLKFADRPFMRFKKAWAVALILPFAFNMIDWLSVLPNMLDSFGGVTSAISYITEFIALCAQAYWISHYSK